jgi:AraC-like DNA-binding protein
VDRLQRAHPELPVALWLDCVGPDNVPMIIAAAERGVRGIVPAEVPDPTVLRRQLTDHADVARDLPHRLRLFGYALQPLTAEYLAILFSRSRDCGRLAEVLRVAGFSRRTLLRLLQDDGLGAASRLHQIVRVLRAVLDIQRQEGKSVARVAQDYGYWDDAALRARIRDVFGTSPSAVKHCLGWERLLRTGLRRAGLPIRRTNR